ncbi:MAG TPA: MarR family transcriptional regulator [Pseudonocardiaceae bacterium]|jgi:DNA-binding MarR family transcriptional regulator|nr:MarR family transcriptional regulator [Pseudonocardiaceae bacterium]
MSSHVHPDESLGFALKRLQQILRTRMDATLATYTLTTPQYAVLALLAEHPGMSNAELARRSFVAAPTMLRIVDGLTEAGLITRADPAPEHRARGTALTNLGRKRLAQASPQVQNYENLLLANTAPEHVEVIMAWLRACANQLGEQPLP